MKKQVNDELTKMVKAFNKKNEELENVYEYEVDRFRRGKYAGVIYYKVMYSSDLDVLIKFVQENRLSMFLGLGRIHLM